jgi:hypothetical protein
VLLEGETLSTVTVAAAAAAGVSLLLSLVLLLQLRRLRRAHDVLTGGDSGMTFVDAVKGQRQETQGLRSDVALLREDLAAARADLSDALRHVAVVRYDAFGDMGGRLSFSAALLDDAGDGLVLTSINGRTETRSYAKGVKAGESDHSLSPEEQQAIAYATRAEPQPGDDANLTGATRRQRRRG